MTVAVAACVCPMHPEVRADEPGPCSICGLALAPATAAAEESEPTP